MSEQALNDVFRPARARRRTAAPRKGFRAYALRRLRQMLVSWLVLSVVGIGANIAFQRYAQETYGIDLADQLAALDKVSGGVLGLSELAGTETEGARMPAAPLPDLSALTGQADPGALPASPGAAREITSTGALRIRVPQTGN